MSKTATRRRRRKPGSTAGPAPDGASIDKMFDVDQEPEEYEFRIQGASGFEGGKDLKLHDEVTVTVGGKVIGDARVLRRRHESGAGSEQEYLARVITIKATGGFIRE